MVSINIDPSLPRI